MTRPLKQKALFVILCLLCISFRARAGIEQRAEGTNLYDIAFDDAALETVVREFGKLPEVNIVVRPEDLKGKVTVHLRGVQWKPALEAILDMFNLMLVRTY